MAAAGAEDAAVQSPTFHGEQARPRASDARYRTVLYGNAPRALIKFVQRHHSDGTVPAGTRLLILAVDVERSGPDSMAHSTIAVGVALVAWGVVPDTHTAFHKLVHRACWGSLSPGTRFDEATWRTFWSKQDPDVLRRFVCTDTATDAANRNEAIMFIMAQCHATARAAGVPLHVVSDNPGYDVPHIDAWLRAAPAARDVTRMCSATPVTTIEAGGVRCVTQQFNMAHGLHYDADGKWRRVRCLRSMQEGVLFAGSRRAPPHTTQHSAAVRRMYALPHDAGVVQRNTHMPSDDAHACAVDYAHVMSIKAGHAALRRVPRNAAQ